jgi:sugar (pentulose or hexulose) kinase
MNGREQIENGKTALGIEFGSTRIKAVLTGETGEVLAAGSHEWENRLQDKIWTYTMEDITAGLRSCYADLKKSVRKAYGTGIKKTGAIGISAMMHGYMPFDGTGNLLVPFRTWRNSMTGEATGVLTELFDFNIPERWSIAHLYQAVLNQEEHVKDIAFITTLAGFIHWKLTGRKVLGIGDASGMFPVDSTEKNYDRVKLEKFDRLVEEQHYPWKLADILPCVLQAGENAGYLTEEGAKFLDESGELEAGIPMCPPEGDAGTGMVATDSVAVRTGNVSAGTSVFAMIVLEKALHALHREIDMVTTPVGLPCAMVHANNCTSDLNAWVGIFREFAGEIGSDIDTDRLYGTLYRKALEGDRDCGGLLSYGYYSGENITGLKEGRPLFVRKPDAKFNLSNFMRTGLYTSLGALKIGLDILIKEEDVKVDRIMGHGGLFKTEEVGQKIMAAAMDAPVTVMKTAGEGGPWGMAVLALYMKNRETGEALETFLSRKIFMNQQGTTVNPDPEDVKGFDEFLKQYKAGLPIEREAVQVL